MIEGFLFGRKFVIKTPKSERHFAIVWSDNCWCWYYRMEKKKCTHTIIRPINPWHHIKYKATWYYRYLSMLFTGTLYKQCQGCGEGISKWKIRNPNHGYGNRWFNCCDRCRNFYDMRWSAMEIIGWKNGKAVATKEKLYNHEASEAAKKIIEEIERMMEE